MYKSTTKPTKGWLKGCDFCCEKVTLASLEVNPTDEKIDSGGVYRVSCGIKIFGTKSQKNYRK